MLSEISRRIGRFTQLFFQPQTAAIDFLHKCGAADLQHPAHLSTRRGPDSSLTALVCAGSRPQLDGSDNPRLGWCSRVHRSRPMEAGSLVGGHLRLYIDELLGRSATGACAVAFCKVAAPGGICLPSVQDGTAAGRILEMWKVRAAV